ncbi:MAG: alanine racemase [Candidatus Kapabacteria bacterium]|nr:alanine racemase [Candidatus Kapabacteria bacterium]MCS7169030.1 alanine racemase [Candidatus Kapabacteria bacterium]MDW7997374.1 alanine racemase [Bacteroidota bacterium]MDW8224423.1 alanine racemase [Bacteroidota bacterium]
MHLDELPTPALVLEYPVLLRNLQLMQQRTQLWGVALRPHAKTHKCAEIAHLQLRLGAIGLTVATLTEAYFFANAGVEDITWAFPLPLWAVEPALELARHIRLRLLLDNITAAKALSDACAHHGQRVHVWLEVDCGARRSGLDPKSPLLLHVAEFVARSPWLELDGLLTHAGHAYRAASPEELRLIALQEQELLLEASHRLQQAGIPILGISIGSTPTIMASETLLPGISEVRPGNYVFYDYTQVLLGSCRLSDCALTVLATVVSHQPSAEHFVIDAGALALSLDPGPQHLMPVPSFGAVMEITDGTARLDPDVRISRLTQEHGLVAATQPGHLEKRYRVGDRVRILENHSCLTAALHDYYWVCDSAGNIMSCWPIARQRSFVDKSAVPSFRSLPEDSTPF